MRGPEGVVIGLVKDIGDPLDEGRVRVQYPWMSDTELSGWAPIVRSLAGKDRGLYFMPELEDEALVAFEHGNFDHPFIIGFLHNGVDRPPDDGIDAEVRRLRTVSGHVLEFDDRSGQERILLKTAGGHQLEMKDEAGTIELKSTGGQQITMADTPASIKLSTTAGTTVELDDVPSQVRLTTSTGVSVTVSDAGGVSVSAAAGAVTITSPTATVNATAACTVIAPTITLNGAAVTVNSALAAFTGVVQCSTLITNAVVSGAYTPGVGNLL